MTSSKDSEPLIALLRLILRLSLLSNQRAATDEEMESAEMAQPEMHIWADLVAGSWQ
jgi:hypothetical protein